MTIGKASEKTFDGKFSVVYNVVHVESSVQSAINVGGIAGINTGIIYNCDIINTSIYASIADNNNNCLAVLRVGGITSHNISEANIMSCRVINSSIVGIMPLVSEDSGDNNNGTLGGICAENFESSTIEECAIIGSYLELQIHGDGTKKNKASPYGIIGNIVAEFASGLLKDCVVDSTTTSIFGSQGGNTTPTLYAGTIIGSYLGGSVSNCYAHTSVYVTLSTSTSGPNATTLLVGAYGTSGCNNYSDMSELSENIQALIKKAFV